MKLGVVSQMLAPHTKPDVLLCLRISYKNAPDEARYVWFDGFEHGLARCYYSTLSPGKPPRFELGWEDVDLWSGAIICSEDEIQYKSRDELLLYFAELLKKHAANHVDLGTLFQQKAFEASGGRPS